MRVIPTVPLHHIAQQPHTNTSVTGQAPGARRKLHKLRCGEENPFSASHSMVTAKPHPTVRAGSRDLFMGEELTKKQKTEKQKNRCPGSFVTPQNHKIHVVQNMKED